VRRGRPCLEGHGLHCGVCLSVVTRGGAEPMIAFPDSSIATQNLAEGHETPVRVKPVSLVVSSLGSISLPIHREELRPGVAAMNALFPATATQSDAEGHETPVSPALLTWTIRQACVPPVGSVETNASLASATTHTFREAHDTAVGVKPGTAAIRRRG